MRKTAVVLGVATVAAGALLVVPQTVPEVSRGDTAVTSVRVNEGRTVELGPAETRSFPIEVTATDNSGIRTVDPIGVWGPNYGVLAVGPMSCTPLNATGTAARCRATVTVDTAGHRLYDDEAGTWFVDLRVRANDGDRYVAKTAGGFSLKRTGRLDEAAMPAHAAIGEQVAVTGRLLRTSWDHDGYLPQQGVPVYLQFRPAGSAQWTTVATAGSDADGRVGAQVTAVGSGDFQWWAAGDKWTGGALSEPLPLTVDRPPAQD
ncbi:hypothetical protein [Kitasatospora paracochleata]|uniref:Neocarzinostatin family protein n=1 Tax=Kitasatospora paracochleata TaxID=58354 RepID=A0ABT1J5H0_9ACTN|nr:hypothetical protein [Kitasatospora paracochleata]MCP2312675.1 hypothetical protein [Kitasatospora paracochleata]